MDNFELNYCHWASSCRRKIRFSHAHHAMLRIQCILQSATAVEATSLVSYQCSHCGGFHIGHKREGRGD